MSPSAEYWLRLIRAQGIGPAKQKQLLQQYGNITGLFAAFDQHRLPQDIQQALDGVQPQQIESDLLWLQQQDAAMVTVEDPHYPQQLHSFSSVPLVLFMKGNLQALQEPMLGIVGSRNPTKQGAESAYDFAHYLASVGIGTISGLAMGIDAQAHSGCLSGEGITVAVLGTGPDRVYPAQNRDLAHQIVANNGMLLSEFPPGTSPKSSHFPQRNRLISLFSLGVLVVEAALKSGSLITAKYAMEQGREVFAIPGSIHNPLARGCHKLIRDGAKLVENAADIFEEIAPLLQQYIIKQPPPQPETQEVVQLSTEEQRVIDAIATGPARIDEIIGRSGLTAPQVSSILLQLELNGVVNLSASGYTPA